MFWTQCECTRRCKYCNAAQLRVLIVKETPTAFPSPPPFGSKRNIYAPES
jgi:hypothetical protein